jgi:hypothetical protein
LYFSFCVYIAFVFDMVSSSISVIRIIIVGWKLFACEFVYVGGDVD